MSHITIAFSTADELIKNFRQNSTNRDNKNHTFVLIHPRKYYGSYGGLLKNQDLSKINKFSFLKGSIDQKFSIVWWLISNPPRVGTRLTDGERVLIPLKIYFKLKSKHADLAIRSGKSSYYGPQYKQFYC